MTVAQNPTLWAMAGLLFNMAGASLLYLAISSAADDQGGAKRAEHWFEARCGALLLVLGFFLQATGTAGSHAMDTAATLILLGLALALIFYVAAGRELVAEALCAKASAATADARPQLITSDRSPPARQLEDLRQAMAAGA